MIPRIAVSALALLLVGCDKTQSDERFYFIAGSTGLGVDVFVNGNPTNGGNALTLFLVDGQNTIELKGDFLEGGYHLQVFRGRSIFDAASQKIVEQQLASEGPDDGIIEFQAEIGDQWAWRRADVLGTLSEEDRTAIYAIYDSVCAEMRSDGFEPKKLLSRGDVALWSESPEHAATMDQQFEEIGAKIPPRSELVFRNATHDELRLLTGIQIAMLTCDQDKLVYLGPPEDEDPPESGEVRWTFYYGFSEMFFVKLKGSWSLLIPNL